jgi:hypothetical protein
MIEDIFDGGFRRSAAFAGPDPDWEAQIGAAWDREQEAEKGMASPCYCDAGPRPHEHGPKCRRDYPESYNMPRRPE